MSKEKKINSAEEGWEIKDRRYVIRGDRNPLTFTIKSRHTEKYPLLYFDTDNNTQRALRYATNQASPFVDEQKGEVTLRHIVFEDGALFVPKQEQALQKLLSLYHPDRNKRFAELMPVKEAEDEVQIINYQIDAMMLARDMGIDQAEAIMRTEIGSQVNDLSSKELRRDLLKFAKDQSYLFLELAQDDNVELRNFGVKATEMGIIKLSPDQRTFTWVSNNRKLMHVPFDEHPYSALAAWFKTDEGMEIYQNIEKRLN